MELGTADADPGELATGYLDVTDLPTGGAERLPVVVAEGDADGPELWITGTLHGDEATGLAVAQDTMDETLPTGLAGTVVCIPNLNPAGLRRNERTSYYHDDDPNRYFPDPDAETTRPPKVQELIDRRVYEAFADSADALVNLHTSVVDSVPFTIRHRVFYGDRRTESAARTLAETQGRLVEAFGLPVLNQYPEPEYTDRGLQRSTTGAALDVAGIPAMTPELGGHSVVDDDITAAGVAGCYRVMVALGMLESVPEEVAAADPGFKKPVDYSVRRAQHPRTDTPGIVRHRVEPGDVVAAGDPVADIVTPHGEHKATVESERDGYVVGRTEGVAVYENDALCYLAVRDEDDVVVERDGE
ncbi:succinylglutamate desuccinylase/aspartoacylase family protein [Halorussus marinus]|uniref:succinylglutamate desuccinylase/aspartoacylase family protein n=1 Tax=Halorussus marinus TaxID=2505976 RepID=UPI00106F09F8|nr:succinylglutamate desuccinylase/aspartoacylase family protein [Halorussus marinus]